MNKVIIMRGLPASGKSTVAKALVDEADGKLKRISRDDFRMMLDNGTYSNVDERLVTTLRDHAIVSALKAGYDVVIDETTTTRRRVNELISVARSSRRPVEFDIRIIDTPIEECLRRNALRTGPARVPDEAIERMHRQWTEDEAAAAEEERRRQEAVEAQVGRRATVATHRAGVQDRT